MIIPLDYYHNSFCLTSHATNIIPAYYIRIDLHGDGDGDGLSETILFITGHWKILLLPSGVQKGSIGNGRVTRHPRTSFSPFRFGLAFIFLSFGTVTFDIQVGLEPCPPTHHQIGNLRNYYHGSVAFDAILWVHPGDLVFIFAVRSPQSAAEIAIVLCSATTSRYPLLFVGKGLPFNRDGTKLSLLCWLSQKGPLFPLHRAWLVATSLTQQREQIVVSSKPEANRSRAEEGSLYSAHIYRHGVEIERPVLSTPGTKRL